MIQPRPTIDLGYPTPARGRIPAFHSLEEEAAFWDTHDVTDFAEESTPVQVNVGQELAERLTLRLDQADRQKLAKHARE
jgi:CopG antitoxin of type II toxin-antitoxin system